MALKCLTNPTDLVVVLSAMWGSWKEINSSGVLVELALLFVNIRLGAQTRSWNHFTFSCLNCCFVLCPVEKWLQSFNNSFFNSCINGIVLQHAYLKAVWEIRKKHDTVDCWTLGRKEDSANNLKFNTVECSWPQMTLSTCLFNWSWHQKAPWRLLGTSWVWTTTK